MEESLSEFSAKIRRASSHHIHKITNSYGVYDFYKFYRRTKPKDKKFILTESQYFAIIRRINETLAKNFSYGKEVRFPMRMGTIELRKTTKTPRIKDGKLVFNTMIDWDKTIKLWYEDEESFKNKTLVKMEAKEIFRTFYNKSMATFNNKAFYLIQINKELRRDISKNIRKGIIDAFLMY